MKRNTPLPFRVFSISFLVLWICLSMPAEAQKPLTDSLKKVLAGSAEDTLRVNTLNSLAWQTANTDPDEALNYSFSALQLAEKLQWTKGLGNSYHQLGWFFYLKTDYSNALEYDFKALPIWDQMEKELSGYPLLRLFSSKSATLCNIGIVYDEQEDFTKALDFYYRALEYGEKSGNKIYPAAILGNIGIILMKKKEYANALDHYNRGLKLKEELKDKKGIGLFLGNIGIVYMKQGDHEKALSCFFRSLELKKETGNKSGTAITLGNIGELYLTEKKPDLARKFLTQALSLASETGDLAGCKEWSHHLYQLDSMEGDHAHALLNYKLYINYQDSIANEENTRAQTRTEMQYEFDKKDRQTRADQEKKDTVTRIVIWSISGGLALTLLLVVFISRSYRQKKKANLIIAGQKEEVEQQKTKIEEKQKEILDSIQYARRIQRSLLPTVKYIEKNLKRLNRSAGLLLLLFSFPTLLSFSQGNTDSLLSYLKSCGEDTSKVNTLNALSKQHVNMDVPSALRYSKQALQLAQTLRWRKGEANAIHAMGHAEFIQGNYDAAISNWEKALQIREQDKDLYGMSRSYSNLGLAYYQKADYPKALDLYTKSLRIAEQIQDKKWEAIQLGNIGNIFSNQADYPKALEYYFRSLKISEAIGDNAGTARQLGNVAIVYSEQKDFPKSLDYYFRTLKLAEELGDKNRAAIQLANISNVYRDQAVAANDTAQKLMLLKRSLDHSFQAMKMVNELQTKNGLINILGGIGNAYADIASLSPEGKPQQELFAKAETNYMEALKLAEEMGDDFNRAAWMGNIGSMYMRTKEYTKAKNFLSQAVALSTSLKIIDQLQEQEYNFSQLEERLGNYEEAVKHYKAYIAARNEITNDANVKKQTRSELQYEFDKKETAEKAKQDKKDAVNNVIIYSIGSGSALLLILAFFIFRSYRQKQRINLIITVQKEEVEHQKTILEEKQKELLDSIYYARRIQRSLLPTERYIERQLQKSQC